MSIDYENYVKRSMDNEESEFEELNSDSIIEKFRKLQQIHSTHYPLRTKIIEKQTPNQWLETITQNKIKLIVDKYNKAINNVYAKSKEDYDDKNTTIEIRDSLDLFSGSLTCDEEENNNYTSIVFYVIDNNEKINNEVIEHYPYTKESYVYIDYDDCCVHAIYFLLLSDINYKYNPKFVMNIVPSLACELVNSLADLKMIKQNCVCFSTSYKYMTEEENIKECFLTKKLIKNIQAHVLCKNLKAVEVNNNEYQPYASTKLCVVDDEREDVNRELLDSLPDEYSVTKLNKILHIYMKMSKLRKYIDIIRKRLVYLYVKEKLINNKLCIKSNKSNEVITLLKSSS